MAEISLSIIQFVLTKTSEKLILSSACRLYSKQISEFLILSTDTSKDWYDYELPSNNNRVGMVATTMSFLHLNTRKL